jgi:hypothetical protein
MAEETKQDATKATPTPDPNLHKQPDPAALKQEQDRARHINQHLQAIKSHGGR